MSFSYKYFTIFVDGIVGFFHSLTLCASLAERDVIRTIKRNIMIGKYPDFKDIKVEWTKLHTLIVMAITFSVIMFLINQAKSS
jgi:hypothetical protein